MIGLERYQTYDLARTGNVTVQPNRCDALGLIKGIVPEQLPGKL